MASGHNEWASRKEQIEEEKMYELEFKKEREAKKAAKQREKAKRKMESWNVRQDVYQSVVDTIPKVHGDRWLDSLFEVGTALAAVDVFMTTLAPRDLREQYVLASKGKKAASKTLGSSYGGAAVDSTSKRGGGAGGLKAMRKFFVDGCKKHAVTFANVPFRPEDCVSCCARCKFVLLALPCCALTR